VIESGADKEMCADFAIEVNRGVKYVIVEIFETGLIKGYAIDC